MAVKKAETKEFKTEIVYQVKVGDRVIGSTSLFKNYLGDKPEETLKQLKGIPEEFLNSIELVPFEGPSNTTTSVLDMLGK